MLYPPRFRPASAPYPPRIHALSAPNLPPRSHGLCPPRIRSVSALYPLCMRSISALYPFCIRPVSAPASALPFALHACCALMRWPVSTPAPAPSPAVRSLAIRRPSLRSTRLLCLLFSSAQIAPRGHPPGGIPPGSIPQGHFLRGAFLPLPLLRACHRRAGFLCYFVLILC